MPPASHTLQDVPVVVEVAAETSGQSWPGSHNTKRMRERAALLQQDEDGMWGESKDAEGGYVFIRNLGEHSKKVLDEKLHRDTLGRIVETAKKVHGQEARALAKIRGLSTQVKRARTGAVRERPGRANRNTVIFKADSVEVL